MTLTLSLIGSIPVAIVPFQKYLTLSKSKEIQPNPNPNPSAHKFVLTLTLVRAQKIVLTLVRGLSL